MTLKELLLKYQGEHITYSQYLTTEEWQVKRNEIIERDHYLCTSCKKAATFYLKNFNSPIKFHFWNVSEEDGRIMPLKANEKSRLEITDKAYHLEVHHHRYILNRLPWDYKNEDLITLCNHCHTEFHQHNKVLVYSEDEKTELEYEPCSKCHGTGYIPEYRHVQEGLCFQCMGNRYLFNIIK